MVELKNGLGTILTALCFFVLISSCNSPNTKPADKPEPVQKTAVNASSDKRQLIVFFGNSLTAGYGLNEDEAFPALIQDILDSLELPFTTVNAGLSGETTAGGNRRIEWVLKQPMDIFMLELGGNDMLRGTPVEETEKNLRGIIKKVRTAHPDIPILLAGMLAPPNLGKEYTDAFSEIYPRLANELDLTLIPFFLECVAGEPTLNQADGIHPTAEGHRLISKTVWKYLQPIIASGVSEG